MSFHWCPRLEAVAKISQAAMHAPTLNDKCMRDSDIGSVGRGILLNYYNICEARGLRRFMVPNYFGVSCT